MLIKRELTQQPPLAYAGFSGAIGANLLHDKEASTKSDWAFLYTYLKDHSLFKDENAISLMVKFAETAFYCSSQIFLILKGEIESYTARKNTSFLLMHPYTDKVLLFRTYETDMLINMFDVNLNRPETVHELSYSNDDILSFTLKNSGLSVNFRTNDVKEYLEYLSEMNKNRLLY